MGGITSVMDQLKKAVHAQKLASDGKMVYPNEMLLVTIGIISDVVRQYMYEWWQREAPQYPLVIIDREGLYQQVLKH